MVDLLTVIPIWVSYFGFENVPYSLLYSFTDGVIYIMYALNSTKVLRALRVRKTLMLIEDAVDRCFADIALIMVSMILFSKCG